MATMAQIREGLAANLRTIRGVQVSPYVMANPTPPALQVMAGETTYDLAMARGLDRVEMTVQGFVGFVSDIGSAKLLDKFRDPSGANSVKAALEADKTLGGVAQTLHVTSAGPDQQVVFDGRPPLLGAEWRVTVYVS